MCSVRQKLMVCNFSSKPLVITYKGLPTKSGQGDRRADIVTGTERQGRLALAAQRNQAARLAA